MSLVGLLARVSIGDSIIDEFLLILSDPIIGELSHIISSCVEIKEFVFRPRVVPSCHVALGFFRCNYSNSVCSLMIMLLALF